MKLIPRALPLAHGGNPILAASRPSPLRRRRRGHRRSPRGPQGRWRRGVLVILTQISRRPMAISRRPVAGAYCPWGGVPHGGGAAPEGRLVVATWRHAGGPDLGFRSASSSGQCLPLPSVMRRGPGRAERRWCCPGRTLAAPYFISRRLAGQWWWSSSSSEMAGQRLGDRISRSII